MDLFFTVDGFLVNILQEICILDNKGMHQKPFFNSNFELNITHIELNIKHKLNHCRVLMFRPFGCTENCYKQKKNKV